MAFGHLHDALQPGPQTFWPSFQRTLQSAAGGRQRHWLPQERLRLRASQPGARQAAALETKALAFRWSSYPQYLEARSARPSWLRVDRLLGEHGIPKDSPAGRKQFERRMELRRAAEDGAEFGPLLRAWRVGSEEVRQ